MYLCVGFYVWVVGAYGSQKDMSSPLLPRDTSNCELLDMCFGDQIKTSTKTAMIQNYWAIPSTLLQSLVTFLFSQGLE